MNSSMLAGERRWATARRGGMTVLGKVAVPKPINLPSQRLENHGLDPNVEIVPKGTVSWGSRSSSSGSNPWSSSLSPNADGGTVSPSHLSGRPSSGSGTRPSTAGSDRTHDAVPNAWASNSRPSSASGTLSSNQAPSALLRPRSAENRPNSSQLSRFAEPVAKNPTAWSSSVTAERLGVKSSKDDGFSLSSGDFPTLGTEKDNSVKNESEDHSRPSSASGRINQPIDDTGPPADVKHGTVDTWRADGSQSADDDVHPSMERWQGDPHQHFNPNAAPHHFDAWRGPPMNGPGGWYGGRPQGPAFGAHAPPGGFPMEPFPYYHRPQIPPPPLAGPQPVPPPGPRGPHPKNGDMYRPQMPEAYPRPGMPFRPGGPGFYPRPPGPMAFDGYYGPPVGYERDMPYMGIPGGPPVYNGYPPSNPDISNPHGRATGRGPPGKTMSEEVDHWDDARGPKRVPLRSHNECDQREGGNREQSMQHNVSHSGKRHFPVSSRKSEWGAEEDTEEDMFAKRKIQGDTTFHSYENRVHSADGVKVKSIEGMGNVKGGNDNWTNRSSSVKSFPPVVTPLPVAIERDPPPAVSRNSSLMNKIDGLNAKFRGSDGWNDSPSDYNNEEERNRSKVVNVKISDNSAEVGNIAGSFERTPASRDFISGHHEVVIPVGDNVIQPAAVVSRRSYHGGHSRVDQRGRGRFNSQEADGWRRKPLNTESLSTVTASNNESLLNARVGGPNIVGEASESYIIEPEGKIESDSAETYESTDIQRAKMRELAKQRALQLQKEEEERIKEQKAKALAKLEELNRRTLAEEVVNQKPERTQQELHIVTGPMIAELNSEEPGFNLVPSPAVATIERESNPNQAVQTVKESISLHLDIKGTATESNASAQSTNEDSHDSSMKKGVSQVTDGGISRHKRTSGYKQRHNNLLQKSSNENSVSSEAPKNHPHVSTTEITLKEIPLSDSRPSESNVLNTSNAVVEPSAQQRRKINRAHKTKPKPDETPAASAVPTLPPVSSDTNQGNEAIGNGGSNDSNNVSTVIEPDSGLQAQGACSSVPNEESQNRVPNQWKPHHSRKLPRSQQTHRFNEKLHGSGDTVVWAPVRSQNKAKGSDDASQNSTQESANSAKADNVGPNSLKGKRAEMERYVPKPVAKELAQQGSVPPLSSSVRSNEGAGGGQCGSSVEINEGDGNHNRNKKDHGAWRHGGSTDSSRMKGVHTGTSSTSEPVKEIHQSSEINTANADTKSSVKDQGATGRGRRHPQRGPRSTGKNPDPESSEIDGSSIQPALDVNQTDRNNASKENRSFGERAPHWQPKGNRPNSANNQHGSRTTGSESVTTEINKIPKKDHPQLEPGESVNVKNNMVEESTASHRRDFGQENKPVPYKGRPYSPSLDIVDSGETTGDHHERNVSSGYRRGGRQNNRPARGHDSRGDWSSGHDNRSNNRERQRQNVQYEYQPVGPVKGKRPDKAEEPAADGGGGDSMDQRHRERGYGHMKRGGNSYKRQSGAAAHVASVVE